MQLTYTDLEEMTIRVTLDEGETWSDFVGPMEAFVPVDEGNRHYQDILADELTVPAYEAPELPLEASSETVESLLAQIRTIETKLSTMQRTIDS